MDAQGPFDAIADSLQHLRAEAGDVSYAEIAARVSARREAEGQSAAASRIARSTIFDVFQTGRRRINADLVREISLALGADDDEAEDWRRRCLDARKRVLASRPLGSDSGPTLRTLRTALVIAVLVGCVFLNIFGGTVAARLELPLFLDMAGTATAAFAFGPWYGVIVGLGTNSLGAITSTPETILFALVNIAGAVVWGYGIRRFARTIPRFVLLNIIVALACTLVATPLNAVMYDGVSGHASDSFIAALRAVEGLWPAVFSVNFLASLADKILAGFIGLALARQLIPLALSDGQLAQNPLLVRRSKPVPAGATKRTRASQG